MEFSTAFLGKDYSRKNSGYDSQEGSLIWTNKINVANVVTHIRDKEIDMKNIIFVAGLALAVACTSYAAEDAKPKTKKVCVDQQGKDGKPVMDPKTGKPKQDCKEMKKHKKHEGTAIPEKK